jgi:serine/threonine protein kinase
MPVTSSEARTSTLGKYELLEKIGEGSMAAVFKGREQATGRLVAVKVASQWLRGDPVLLKRFEQEFRTAHSLHHPHLVHALEYCPDAETPYLVMEFVDGRDLWKRIEAAGRLPEAEAVRLIVQVAHGLHEAHKHGIIHRDIKPENILVTADGQAKLTDLGLVKDLEANLDLTQPAKGLGTPNFIAPEQFGNARQAGVRCDIYALGATLYMALTGELPFNGRSLNKILGMKLKNELRPARELVPTVSERVDWAIRRALQAEASHRYASCPEFIAALTGEAAPGTTAEQLAAAGQPAEISKRRGRERRAWVRYCCNLDTACNLNVSVHADEGDLQDRWQAVVRDVSVGGVGLVLNRRFEPGTLLTVELREDDDGPPRSVEMCVVHVEKEARGRWFIGAAFTKRLAKEELRKLL